MYTQTHTHTQHWHFTVKTGKTMSLGSNTKK